MSKTKRTADAIEIIEHRLKDDPELALMVEEERRKLGMAEKIRTARNKAGLTQKEVARRTGCAQSSIARLESCEYERLS
ncbi:MAG: helix-turn-helix transcriptional regulator [Candidatus Hatepunaea meridiana]|nr:helix-turn-helix transcriptional regulator [Candidatus Hatepunaea meridiana]